MEQEKNISLDEDERQILKDCLSDDKRKAKLRAQLELAKIIAKPLMMREISDEELDKIFGTIKEFKNDNDNNI